MRLIFHLSYDFKNGNKSINFWTPEEDCSVKYNDLDSAVRNCLKLKTKPIFYAKSDLVSAFRILPMLPKHRKYLLMMAENPETGKKMYFIDKNLPFGSSISCSHFQKFSNALRHIVEELYGSKNQHITNYLDDFLFYTPTQRSCNSLVRLFLSICDQIGFPVSLEKTEWACNSIVFLGILLNGNDFTMGIPIEKRIKAVNMIKYFSEKRKATVKELQRLCGLLNFLNRAVVPGRPFTRRMYAKYSAESLVNKKGEKLKQFHHINLDSEFRNDCMVWRIFLDNPEIVNRPFIDLSQKITAKNLNFYSDASASENLGFGVIFGTEWISQCWEPGFIRICKPSIEYLELYALCVGIYAWGHKMTNTRVIIYCDNISVCFMVNNLTSGCKHCMYLIRLITLNNLLNNRRIFVRHVLGKKNILADSLSRMSFLRFFNNVPAGVNKSPNTIPTELWPLTELWSRSKIL